MVQSQRDWLGSFSVEAMSGVDESTAMLDKTFRSMRGGKGLRIFNVSGSELACSN